MTAPDEFAELLAEPGVRETLVLRSSLGFMAFHGGDLERATDVIATEAAVRSGASVYAVIQPKGMRRHIPSHRVTPAASPALARFAGHVEVAVALHGYGRAGFWTSLLVGGTNRALAAHVAQLLRPALDGYEVVDDLSLIPEDLRGQHAANPVNLPRGGGAQIELPPRVRGLTPHRSSTEPLIAALAAAAVAWSAGHTVGSPATPVDAQGDPWP